jgi:hypothetical protein
MSDTPQPFQDPVSATTSRSVLAFVFNQLLRGHAFAAMVRVDACSNNGGLTEQGTVDATVLVNQVGGGGTNPTEHISIYGMQYLRIQGGKNAVIMDPQVGDIGIAIFAMRDQTNVIAAKGPASPGSNRVCDYSDGMYLGGLLNGVPTQYVQFLLDGDGNPNGINVVSPVKVTIQAPEVDVVASTKFNVTSPDSEFSGNITAQGTITGVTQVVQGSGGSAVHLSTHEHPTAAPGAPSPPTPGT